MFFSEEQQRDRWKLALHNIDVMSSEESTTEGDEEVILVRPLPWRSHQVNEKMRRLDEKINSEKSALAKRQVKKRVPSLQYSSRPKPVSNIPGGYPVWMFKEQ